MKFIKVLPVALCALMTLTGCRGGGNTSADESLEFNSDGEIEFKNVKLTFGNPITGADGAHMRKLVKDFNEEYKGKIEIQESYVRSGRYAYRSRRGNNQLHCLRTAQDGYTRTLL